MDPCWSSSLGGRLRRWSRWTGLLPALLVFLGVPLLAEGQGVLELDPGNGAATLRLPLGPGIGRPGFRFVPALMGKFAPQVERTPPEAGAPWRVAATGFDLCPGILELRWVPGDGGMALLAARWTGPDGSGGSARGAAWVPAGAGTAGPAWFPLEGLGGEVLTTEERDGGGFPARVQVLRGELRYSFQRGLDGASPWDRSARYRLEAIRTRSGEALSFTYGANGVDFEATWGTAQVRVTLAGTTAAAPAPALDAAGSMPPAADRQVRLEVTHIGLEVPCRYAITVLARPEGLVGEGGADPGDRLHALQVTRVEGTDPEEWIEFRYGQAPPASGAGAGGTRFAPVVLREIVQPGRIVELEWAGWPGWRPGDADGGAALAAWSFGVAALRERDPDGGAEAEGATYRRLAPGDIRTAPVPEAVPARSWVRQSRHFALAGEPCRTHVRDRWGLGGRARDRSEAGEPGSRLAYRGGDDIPTLERDPLTGSLVPVSGELTRWITWKEGAEGPAPDPHDRPAVGPGPLGLLGGMPPRKAAPPASESKGTGRPEPPPQDAPAQAGERVLNLPPEYDPATGEVTLSVIAGQIPEGQGNGGAAGPGWAMPGGGGGFAVRAGTGAPEQPADARAQAGLAAVSAQLALNERMQAENHEAAALHREIGARVAAQDVAMSRSLAAMTAQVEAAQARERLASAARRTEFRQRMQASRNMGHQCALNHLSGHVAAQVDESREQRDLAEREAAAQAHMAAEHARLAAQSSGLANESAQAAMEARGRAAEVGRGAEESERQAAMGQQRAMEARNRALIAEREAAETEGRVAGLRRQLAELVQRARGETEGKAQVEPAQPAALSEMGVPQPATLPAPNRDAIAKLRPIAASQEGKPGEVLILIWDWEGAGVGSGASVGHVASALKIGGKWRILHSQFPHEAGGKSTPLGPNITIADPHTLVQEEGNRRPESAYLVTIPNLGSFAASLVRDLEKPCWRANPGWRPDDSTNCVYGTIQALRAGGAPLSAMWANQTLILPILPYTPRDLRTALKRDEPFGVIHKYKVHHNNELINVIEWEKPSHD